MKNGEQVATFEEAFAEYVGARYAIAASNGTVTLQAALHALGVKPGDRVATTPLTMAATSIAILNVGAVPMFCDVDQETWLMRWTGGQGIHLPVMLYGLHPTGPMERGPNWLEVVQDAAQTLMPYNGAAFTSFSFQSSKILALGEGGMLVTDSEELAESARSYLSLGYRMGASQARIDSHAIRSPTFERHHRWPAINGRMNDLTAEEGLARLARVYADRDLITREALPDTRYVDLALQQRAACAALYRDAIAGCDWLTPQRVPEGWTHDYWAYAVACDYYMRAIELQDAIVRHGGERPYGAWRLTYQEPAFRHLAPCVSRRNADGIYGPIGPGCPVAEDLQPRLLQFQTNNIASAERNAAALRKAIREIGG